MKRILIIVFILLASIYALGQNYELYLQKAFELLKKGNKENAEKCYGVYKTMTNKTDGNFESLLSKFKVKDEWQKSCYIIKLNDSVYIAVQKNDPFQQAVQYSKARTMANASRLGEFCDWRLPREDELLIIIPNIPIDSLLFENYWCSLDSYDKKAFYILNDQTIKTTKNIICQRVIDKHTLSKDTYQRIEWEDGKIEKKGDLICSHYLIVRTFTTNGEPYVPKDPTQTLLFLNIVKKKKYYYY